MKNKIEICYLCGKKLGRKEEISYDHVPPRQFYPSGIRKNTNLHLFTLPTCISCNKSYQKDEDYFVSSLGPLAKDSYTGNELWKDISRQAKRPESKKLIQKVWREFNRTPHGIILPNRKVAKRFDGGRVRRVIWKILRGLYFKENKIFLPEDTKKIIWVGFKDEGLPSIFPYVRNTPSRGNYPGVFDYKYRKEEDFELWAMLFWNTLTAVILFRIQIIHPQARPINQS